MNKIIKNIILSLGISIVFIIVFSLFFNTELSKFSNVNLTFVAIAIIILILKITVQGTRFYFILRTCNIVNIKIGESTLIRIASEFISLITPSYFGGEILKISWLKTKKVSVGKAVSLSFIEILFDVIIGSSIAIITGIYITLFFSLTYGIIITGISLIIILIYTLLIILTIKHKLPTPNIIKRIIRRILGEKKGTKIIRRIAYEKGSYYKNIKEFKKVMKLKNVIALTIMTLIIKSLLGMMLVSVFLALHSNIELILSLAAANISVTIGSIPITPGGSGIMELSSNAVIQSVLGNTYWNMIILWRIIYYYGGLIITGIALSIIIIKRNKLYNRIK